MKRRRGDAGVAPGDVEKKKRLKTQSARAEKHRASLSSASTSAEDLIATISKDEKWRWAKK
eukprot:4236930-Pyramimonas_sp.AAC.1